VTAPRIRRLPDHLVNKIAAGEVVERPASVVKELVENALDALSTQVTVDLRDAGRALIRVTDDGVGMSTDEVDLALLRHATSKLATDADLDAITTLGFRGEALPAICAVTRFSVLSCPRGAETGTLVRGEGGTVSEKLLVAAPEGTTVEAQDLFFNTPARLKFLKSAPAEVAAALRLLEATALAHLEVHFRVSHNGRPVLGAPRARTLRDRVGALWGFERAGRLLEVLRKDGPLAVSGLIAPPQLSRGSRDEIVLIVNGRGATGSQSRSRPTVRCCRAINSVAVLHLELRPKSTSTSTPQGLGPLPRAPPSAGGRVSRGTGRAAQFRWCRHTGAATEVVVRSGLPGVALLPEASPLKAGDQKWPPHSPSPRTAPPARTTVLLPAKLYSSTSPRPRSARRPSARSSVSSRTPSSSPRATTRCSSSTSTWPTSACCSSACCATWTRDRSRPRAASRSRWAGAGQAALVQRRRPSGAWASASRVERLHRGAAGGAGLLRGQEPRRLIESLVEDVNRPRKGEPVPLLHRALSFVMPRGHQGAASSVKRWPGSSPTSR
jgi:DNA mismatch repair protein MutL